MHDETLMKCKKSLANCAKVGDAMKGLKGANEVSAWLQCIAWHGHGCYLTLDGCDILQDYNAHHTAAMAATHCNP